MFIDKYSTCSLFSFVIKERINVSLSINDKINENIQQIKRKLILYETDLHRLKTEIPNTVSDKRTRAELAVVCEFVFEANEKMSFDLDDLQRS